MERDTIDLLKDLVAIDSQNPSLVPGAAGEGRIAGYVADWAKGPGWRLRSWGRRRGGPACWCERSSGSSGAAAASGRSLLLCGHLDTVGTSEMRTRSRRSSGATGSTGAGPTT